MSNVLALILVDLFLEQFVFIDGEFLSFREGLVPLTDIVGNLDIEGLTAAMGNHPFLYLVLLASREVGELKSERRLCGVLALEVVELPV